MLARSSNQLKMLPPPPSGPLQKKTKKSPRETILVILVMLARSSNQLKMVPMPPSGPLQKIIKSTQKDPQNNLTQKLFNLMVVAQLRVTLYGYIYA